MERRDIFAALGMGEYIWGNAYLYRIAGLDLSVAISRFLKLDEICKTENWKPLGDTWNSLEFSACSRLLMDAIEFDIAYSSTRITPKEIAKNFHRVLLQDFHEADAYCYSNWLNNPWRSEEKGSSWTPLTENTFDVSTVFVNNDKILITCFSSED